MKRILILFFFFISCLLVGQAQIQKGSILLDGQFNLGTTVGEGQNTLNVGLFPSAGFFLSDRFVLGTGIGVGYANNFEFDGGLLVFSPFARFYLDNKPDNPWKLFAELGTELTFVFGGDADPLFGLNTGLGVNYFLNDQTALEISLLYVDEDLGFAGSSNLLSLGFGLRLFLHQGGEEDTGPLSISKANKVFIGGSFASVSTRFRVVDNVDLQINPRAGWFLSEHWAVGSSLLFNYASTSFFNGLGIGVSPFVRFYPQKSNGAFQWFLTAEAGLRYVSNDFDESIPQGPINLNNNRWLTNFRGGVGLNWFLSDQVALEGVLSYDYFETATLPMIERSIGFDLGFQFFLNRNKKDN